MTYIIPHQIRPSMVAQAHAHSIQAWEEYDNLPIDCDIERRSMALHAAKIADEEYHEIYAEWQHNGGQSNWEPSRQDDEHYDPRLDYEAPAVQ